GPEASDEGKEGHTYIPDPPQSSRRKSLSPHHLIFVLSGLHSGPLATVKPTCLSLILGATNTRFPSWQHLQDLPGGRQLSCYRAAVKMLSLPRGAETVEGEDLLDEDSPAGS
ncbi:mCG146029, partial [Mus musculus]